MHWKTLTLSFALAGSLLAQSPAPAPATTAKHPFTFEDMMKLKRVGAPQPSPDGKWIVTASEDSTIDLWRLATRAPR